MGTLGKRKQRPVDALSVKEAGRLGGLATLARYGVNHYKDAGKKGQAALSATCTSDQRRFWGSLGGRPQKRRLFQGEKEINERQDGSPPGL